MKKFTKGLAICGAVLMGSTMFAGCSLTAEQQNAIDTLTSKADELVQVIDKQNKQLSKKEAAEMIELGRSEISYLWESTNMFAEMKIVYGTSVYDTNFKAENGEYGYEIGYTFSKDVHNQVLLGLGTWESNNEEEIEFFKDDYKNQISYGYDYEEGITVGEEGWDDEVFLTGADAMGYGSLERIYEEDIYDVIQHEDGSYEFVLYTERTVNVEASETPDEDGLYGSFTNVLTRANVIIKDSRILSIKGYFVRGTYHIDEDVEKDEHGNYITRYSSPLTSAVNLVDVTYTYDNNVDLIKINEVYSEAQAAYDLAYPAQ